MNRPSRLGVVVVLLCLASVPARAAENPRPGWAHTDGVIHLLPNARVSPASVVDRLMIEELFARWGIGYDERRGEVIRSLFTSDAVLEILQGSSKPMLKVSGADAIVGVLTRAQTGQADQRRHLISNIVIDRLDGHAATALAYAIVAIAKDGQLSMGATVIYRAELAKGSDGMWRFGHLVIGMDAYAGPKPGQAH